MRMKSFAAASAALSAASIATALPTKNILTRSVVESVLNEKIVAKRKETVQSQSNKHDSPNSMSHRRLFFSTGVDLQQACDVSFMECLRNDKCINCFDTLDDQGIDWASVSPNTPCDQVTQLLANAGHCANLAGDAGATKLFCNTFENCVVWEDDFDTDGGGSNDRKSNNGGGEGGPTNSSHIVDCDALTECTWPGFHQSFLGDGVCHENIPGCYNHKICNYDDGDCCEDTCGTSVDKLYYVTCGHDGYACKDPKSAKCDPNLTDQCPGDKSSDSNVNPAPPKIDCAEGEALYRLIMYDSFGDGWDGTKLIMHPTEDQTKEIFSGSLKDGAQGVEYVCLTMQPATCYHVDVKGGIWGNEVSWEIKPMGEGTRAVADGGAPMSCDFGVGAGACERTCSGKANVDTKDDPDYKSYKDMFSCMQTKCVIQMGACDADTTCQPCFGQDDAPEFCFANDNFNAVIDCGLCQCSNDDDMSTFCHDKLTPGGMIQPNKDGKSENKPRQCSPKETLDGSSAVVMFSKCSKFQEVDMMVTDFDQSNFGALDTFEACAHSYQQETLHGGKTALGCMQILSNAMTQPTGEDSTAPSEAIASLATFLYHDAESFCECASKASEKCPLCPNFVHFKTLLYETLDACQALDEIDCDAWNEFYTPCERNLKQMFGSVDFSNQKQCEYTKDSCGGAGPFPAFRKLDCGREIPKPSWDFYNLFANACLDGSAPVPTPTAPTAAPTSGAPVPTAAPVVPPTPKPYRPSDGGHTPYVPPPDDDGSSPDYTPKKQTKKKRRFLHFLILVAIVGGAAYWYQRRRADTFEFVRYRRARNYGGDSEMYSGLAMSDSTSFEPPSLPPPPSEMT